MSSVGLMGFSFRWQKGANQCAVGKMENREWQIKHRGVMGGTEKPREVSDGV